MCVRELQGGTMFFYTTWGEPFSTILTIIVELMLSWV